jgi:hypothetical protein
VFNSTRNEGLKATVASSISRLLRFNPSLVSYTMDKFGVRLILSGKRSGDVVVGGGVAGLRFG